MDDTSSPDPDLGPTGVREGAGRQAVHWRSVLVVPLAAMMLPVVAWAAGGGSAPAADAHVLAVLGIMGLAWAGRRRL